MITGVSTMLTRYRFYRPLRWKVGVLLGLRPPSLHPGGQGLVRQRPEGR